jgi:ABC-2 type transport system permease protein
LVVFARLKLSLLRNTLRAGQRVWAFVLGSLFAGSVALLAFALLAVAPTAPDDRFNLAVVLFAALWLGWVLVPLVAFGTDETLDPSRLSLLPLTRGRLMAGLLVASAVGLVPLACLAGLAGAIVGYGDSVTSSLVIGAAVVVEVALCIVTSRAVTTWMSRALRSRRWRDLTALVLSLLGLALGWGRFFVDDTVGRAAGDGRLDEWMARAADVAQWSPGGMAGRVVAEAGRGRVWVAAGLLVVVGAVIAALLAAWSRGLERALTEADDTSPGRRGGVPELFPAVARLLPRTRSTAVAAKELRYLWRDPRTRSLAVGTIPVALAMPIFLAASGTRDPEAVLAASASAVILGLATSMNLFGIDGEALWTNVVAGHDPRSDLAGKSLTSVAVSMVIVVITAITLAALTSGWAYVPLAVLLGLGTAGVMLGIGCVFSVRAPYPMPESRGNLFASSGPGTGCSTGLVIMAGYLIQGVVYAPLGALVAVGLALWRPALVLAGLVAPVYGYAVWRIGLSFATSWAWSHQPELLAAVSPRR